MPGHDGWLQIIWDGDDQPVTEPADDLSPAPGATDGGDFAAVLACRACGDRRELAPVDYAAGLAAGVLAERARRDGARAGLICPGCGAADFTLQLGGAASGAIRCAGCGLVLDRGDGP